MSRAELAAVPKALQRMVRDRQAIEDKIAQQVKEAANQHVQKQGGACFFTDIKA